LVVADFIARCAGKHTDHKVRGEGNGGSARWLDGWMDGCMDGWMHAWANKNDQLFELGTSDPRAPVRRSKKAKRHDNTLAEMESLHTPRSYHKET